MLSEENSIIMNETKASLNDSLFNKTEVNTLIEECERISDESNPNTVE